jgi:hypothetical protein
MKLARAIKLGFFAAALVPVIWVDFWFLERERRRTERESGAAAAQ